MVEYRMHKGLIIIGYPGIGKTHLAEMPKMPMHNVIDLESSLFDPLKHDDNWHAVYAAQAASLASQGHVVLVSSHKLVREDLKRNYDPDKYAIVAIAPSLRLKDAWIDRLDNRYKEDPSNKNYKALKNVKARYEPQILDILGDPCYNTVILEDMDYKLFRIVRQLVQLYCHSVSKTVRSMYA